MIKNNTQKLKRGLKIATFLALPVMLYFAVFIANGGTAKVASSDVIVSSASIKNTPQKPLSLAESTVKKPAPAVKKAPVKKKVVKKKAKKKEKLTLQPALITAETAPHTAR